MDKIIVLVIVAIAAIFIVRNFYGKLKKKGNAPCGCASCECSPSDSSKDMARRPLGNGENKCACPESRGDAERQSLTDK